ncbi:CapA family protein [Clostridiaceae bacterium OttesenSCG-928-D20]|nr:CapA family protein [Clostridiaceae bacterium OttesenSCG-928-D20]
MNTAKKSLMTILLSGLFLLLGLIIWNSYSLIKGNPLPEHTLVPASSVVAPPSITPKPIEDPNSDETFYEGEGQTATMRLSVFGDIVVHTGINFEARTDDETGYDYAKIFPDAAEQFRNADYAVGCIETTFPEGLDYDGYPLFRTPEQLAKGLADSGVDMLNTASNHSLDSWKSGLDRTLDILDKYEVEHVGTYRTQEERDENAGFRIVERNGIKIAFGAYTYGTNGLPLNNDTYAVNVFTSDYMTTISDVKYDMMKEDIAVAKTLGADIIAVWMHWGNEYEIRSNKMQDDIADFLFQEGVDIILGGHTHVPQPMETRIIEDGDGNTRVGFIMYSLGNFLSCQNDKYTDLTAIVNIDIEKNLDTGKIRFSNIEYVPMYMVDLYDFNIMADWRYRLWNVNEAIADIESGYDRGIITSELSDAIYQAKEDLNRILGPETDIHKRHLGEDTVTDGEDAES